MKYLTRLKKKLDVYRYSGPGEWSVVQIKSMSFPRFDDYLTDDAIQALMEDAISETLSDDAKKDLDAYLNGSTDF